MTGCPSWPAKLAFDPMHRDWCRDESDCPDRHQKAGTETTHRRSTELSVPVPSVFGALTQHHIARVLRRANYPVIPPYHPDVLKES